MYIYIYIYKYSIHHQSFSVLPSENRWKMIEIYHGYVSDPHFQPGGLQTNKIAVPKTMELKRCAQKITGPATSPTRPRWCATLLTLVRGRMRNDAETKDDSETKTGGWTGRGKRENPRSGWKCCKRISTQRRFDGETWDLTTCDEVVGWNRHWVAVEAIYSFNQQP